MSWSIVITDPQKQITQFVLPADTTTVPDGRVKSAMSQTGCPENWLDVPGWDVSVQEGDLNPAKAAQARKVQMQNAPLK